MLKVVTLAALLATLGSLACQRVPALIEFQDPHDMSRQEHDQIRLAPIVVVATIIRDAPAAPVHRSRWNRRVEVQLHRVDVQVENVLAGPLRPGPEKIYYFDWNNPVMGNAWLGLWHAGDRFIFFLRRDADELRTASDYWRDTCTIKVNSGAHPRYSPMPGIPLNQAIADILFTRGTGISADQFADNLPASTVEVPNEYSFPKLRELTADPSAIVRLEACADLESWRQRCR